MANTFGALAYRAVPSSTVDDIAHFVGAPADVTGELLRRVGVPVPENPPLGYQSIRHILGPSGPVQTGFRDLGVVSEQPPQMRAPAPEPAQPVPGFGQSTDKHRDDLIGPAALTLGAPVDAMAYIMNKVGIPTNWTRAPDGQRVPDVPLGALWWQNAINNPSLTWDQVRGALQSPSIHSMRGLGGLF